MAWLYDVETWSTAKRCFQIATLVLSAGMIAFGAGQVGANPQHLKPVILNVVATDHAGHPVTDLQPSDLRVLDDGAQQQITSLRLNQSDPAPSLVILLDLLDLSFQQAGYEAEQLRQAFVGVTASGPIYLYLLAGNGTLYPVQGIPGTDAPRIADEAAWIEHAGPLLNQALKRVAMTRATEFLHNPPERFKATYSVLDSMRQELSRIHGRKQLLWITDGIPSGVLRIPAKANADSEGNANGIPGRRRTVLGA
jgi:VWFA-related protein